MDLFVRFDSLHPSQQFLRSLGVEPVLSKDLICQGHNAAMPLKLEPTNRDPRSRVNDITTE